MAQKTENRTCINYSVFQDHQLESIVHRYQLHAETEYKIFSDS